MSETPIGVSIPNAAEQLNVGTSSVDRAKTVLKQGAAELVSAVERGHVSVNAAATIAERPKDEQVEIVAEAALNACMKTK